MKRRVRLVSTDLGETFSVESLIEPGEMFNMVNIERATGVSMLPPHRSPPGYISTGARIIQKATTSGITTCILCNPSETPFSGTFGVGGPLCDRPDDCKINGPSNKAMQADTVSR